MWLLRGVCPRDRPACPAMVASCSERMKSSEKGVSVLILESMVAGGIDEILIKVWWRRTKVTRII